jgi:CheY-like chemotaxis protein
MGLAPLVMVVEDDGDIREALADVLSDNGYRTLMARDGAEALVVLRSGAERPAAIVLDLMMPVMDGWQFREEQMKHATLSRIPVVLLTAGSDVERKGHAMGASGALRKPVQLAALLEAVEAALR